MSSTLQEARGDGGLGEYATQSASPRLSIFASHVPACKAGRVLGGTRRISPGGSSGSRCFSTIRSLQPVRFHLHSSLRGSTRRVPSVVVSPSPKDLERGDLNLLLPERAFGTGDLLPRLVRSKPFSTVGLAFCRLRLPTSFSQSPHSPTFRTHLSNFALR